MYYIWNDHFENVESYVKTGSPICNPMIFDTSRCGLTDKFKIEELDALTSQYKDNKSFIEALLKYDNKYIKNENHSNIIITHKRKDNVYRDDIIYDDLMINKAAKELISKKKNKATGETVLISNDEVLLEFIEYIKGLVTNEYLRQFVLDSVSKYENNTDLIMLERLITDDVISKDGNLIKKGLKSLLSDYAFFCNVYSQCLETGESTEDVQKDIDKLNNQINYQIRGDYRVLRNLVAWENRLLKFLTELREGCGSYLENVTLSKLIDEIKIQKQYRNGNVELCTVETFYRDREFMYEDVSCSSQPIENKELSTMFQYGGIEEVMKNYDLDEIYGSTQNYKDAVKLGIVKERK